MNRHLSLVFTDAAPGRDADFNNWYGNHHVSEVLGNIPGFVTGQRYVVSPLQREGTLPTRWKYLAVYELEIDDPAVSHDATEAFKAADGFTSHDGSLGEGHAAWIYTSLGERQVETDAAASAKPALGDGEHVFLAFTNPAPGREDDFLRWYDAHVPEVLDTHAGLVTGELFRAGDAQRIGMSPIWQYLALYDLRADDVADYLREEKQPRSRTATRHDGALADDYAVWIYSALGPRMTKAEATAGVVAAR